MIMFTKLMKDAGVSEYLITESIEESSEMFFIKKRLDMRRMKNSDDITIDIYKDIEENGEKYKGVAQILGNPYMTEEEWLEKIKAGSFSAGFVKNKPYELPAKETSELITVESDLSAMDLGDIAEKFAEAIYEEDTDKDSFINSLEVFAKRTTVKILSSKGTDVSYVKTEVNGEFVVQCKEPVDVETYQDFSYGSLELDEIKSLVKRTIAMTKDRANAKEMPKTGTYDVVISYKYLPELFNLYAERSHVGYVYAGYSDYKVGDKIQGDDVKGDLLNVNLVDDTPFDAQGIRLKKRELIKDGELKLIHGGGRFCDYLGVEKVGEYRKISVSEGKVPMEEFFKRPCLHVVNFSDFQMDSFDGHFKGEIRLGYLYDGKGNVSLVTGGSINGSLLEGQKDIVFSKETQKLSLYEGPKAALLKGVSIAGK